MATLISLHAFTFLCLLGLSVFSITEASYGGFSIDLIHRDSQVSPLNSAAESQYVRFRNAVYRSLSRINRFRTKPISEKTLQTDIVPGGGEYFMRISIGTPSVEVLAIADTGSDLIWIQCLPCDLCYKQDTPIFDPGKSSSYHSLACGTKPCNALDNDVRACVQGYKNCGYTYSYGDHSFTNGYLATEKFTISSSKGSPVHLLGVVFGCGTRNGGTFDEKAAGIIGLGGGTLSLNSQLGAKTGGKFSYCLVPLSEESDVTSRITFGQNTAIDGQDVVSTPLAEKEPETYYYLTLEAISVGEKRLVYNTGHAAEEGNIIIDSGTTLTFLDSEFFNELESAVEEAVNAKRVSDPKGLFSICFQDDESNIHLPVITAHFRNADVKLPPVNTFARADEGLLCFTLIPSNDIAIFGNFAQMNYLVGYDLEKRTVSFKPTDCSKQR